MSIPEDAYYSKACSKPGLTSTPTSSFDVSAMVAGNPRYWHAPRAASHERYKKTLVFCDWSVATYERKKREEIYRILREILKKKFNVLLWKDGITQKFIFSSLELLTRGRNKEAETITPALSSTILAQPELKDIPVDQILLMDYFWCRQQCGYDREIKHFCIDDYSKERFDHELLIKFIKEAELSSAQLMVRSFSFSQYNELLGIRKLVFGEGSGDYSVICQSTNVCRLMFMSEYDGAIFKLFLEELNKNDCLFFDIIFMHRCTDSSLVDLIIDIANKSQKLVDFTLPQVAFTDSHVNRLASNNNVKELIVCCSSIKPATLFALLAKFPNLEQLEISTMSVIRSESTKVVVGVDASRQLSAMRSLSFIIDESAPVEHHAAIIMQLSAIMPALTSISISIGEYTTVDILPEIKDGASVDELIVVVQRAIEILRGSIVASGAGCPLRIAEYPMKTLDKKDYRGTSKEAEKTFSRLQPLPEDSIIKGVKQSFELMGLSSGPIENDTGPRPAHFHNAKYFRCLDRDGVESDPDPDIYRLIVSTKMDASDYSLVQGITSVDDLLLTSPPDSSLTKFELSGDIDSEFVPYSNKSHKKYHGRIILSLDNVWQSLPSLSPQEVILRLQVQGISDQYVDIKYSRFNNLYYIKIKDGVSSVPCEVIIDFLLLAPLKPYSLGSIARSDLKNYLDQFFAFDEEELEGLPENPTKQDIMEAVYEQKRGCCYHRARAFKFGIEHKLKLYGVQVRIIRNVAHEYVEVKQSAHSPWIPLHYLGGASEKSIAISVYTYETDDLFNANSDYLRIMSAIREKPAIPAILDRSDFGSMPRVLARIWDPVVQRPRDSVAFIDYLMQQVGRKILVQHDDPAIISALLIRLQQQARISSQNIFVAHSPEDLICSRPWMQLVMGSGKDDDMTANICAAPGGPLHRFLADSSSSPAILVVDYRSFTPQQIVSFNTLLDKKRVVDGVELPEKIIIIALQAGKSSYQGSDFISRFDEVVDCPSLSISHDLVTKDSEDPAVKPGTEDVAGVMTIDLHQSPLWESLLLGEWIIDGDKITFKPGALVKAVTSAKSLRIINPPVGNADFDNLVQNILLQRYLDLYSVKLAIPEFFKITYSFGYNWPELKAAATFKPAAVSEVGPKFTLNPTTFGSFLSKYEIIDGKYYSQPGVLSAGTGSTGINIIVTRSLSLPEWSLFLTKCRQLSVKPIIEIGRNVVMPPELGLDVTTEDGVSVIDFAGATCFADQHTLVIFSKDSDRTAKQIIEKQASEKTLEIDISECTPNDIFLHIDGKSQEQKLIFSQYDCAVLDYLKQGRTVILRGRFSDELIDAIADYQFKYVADATATGKLILIVNQAEAKKFGFMSKQYTHTITSAESLVREFATQQYEKAFGTEVRPWRGLRVLPKDACAVSTASAAEFECERKQAVQKALAYYPFVFISGPTGTGKSTFVDKVLCADGSAYEIYIGESKIIEWAQSKPDGDKRHILFIDEANIGNRDWTKFEGLFADQPYVMVAGKVYNLSPNHKVIFAGNPLSYGGDRHLPLLFARRGYSIIFKPMSLDYIKQRILLPALSGLSGIDGESLGKICELYLNVYKYICDRSPDKILISPRELEMMCLLLVANPKLSIANFMELARYYARRIAQSLLPADAQAGLDSLCDVARELMVIDSADVVISDYAVTASRRPLLRELDDLLALRKFKISASTDVQRYGGLGGLVIEGAPGEGKSHCVVAYLSHLRLAKDRDFYIIPASMESSEKEKLLIKACKEGAIVVIDEINCTDRNERLINDLLMGKLPEGGRPDKPGFLLIATQNPISMPGREAASAALDRRMLKCKLAEYSPAEMRSILITRVGLEEPLADLLIKSYLSAFKQAIDSFKTPLSFRDLIKKAEELKHQLVLSKVGVSSVLSLSTVSYVCVDSSSETIERSRFIYPKSQIMA